MEPPIAQPSPYGLSLLRAEVRLAETRTKVQQEHLVANGVYPLVHADAFEDGRDIDVRARFDALEWIDGHYWLCSGLLAMTERGVDVRALSVTPWPSVSPPEVTGGVLRRVRVGLIRDRAVTLLHRIAEGATAMAAEGVARAEDAAELSAVSDSLSTTRRRGRPPTYDDDHFRRIAEAHLETVRELGTTRGARKALAQRERVSESTIRDWLREARSRGFLPKTRAGKSSLPGPRLTEQRKESE